MEELIDATAQQNFPKQTDKTLDRTVAVHPQVSHGIAQRFETTFSASTNQPLHAGCAGAPAERVPADFVREVGGNRSDADFGDALRRHTRLPLLQNTMLTRSTTLLAEFADVALNAAQMRQRFWRLSEIPATVNVHCLAGDVLGPVEMQGSRSVCENRTGRGSRQIEGASA
jgi:hypothetical protein